MISNTGDLSDNNELQTLSVNGNQLSISDGNAVTLPTGTTYTGGRESISMEMQFQHWILARPMAPNLKS